MSTEADYCVIHEDEENTYVCTDCNKFICDQCVSSDDHNDHEVNSFKNFVKIFDPNEFSETGESDAKAKSIEVVEQRFQYAIDLIRYQADQMIIKVNEIADKKLQDCDEKKSENLQIIDEQGSPTNTWSFSEMLESLPDSRGHNQYAAVARAIIARNCNASGENGEITSASVFLPKFKPGTIKSQSLKKQFGKTNFREENISDIFETILETIYDESGSDDYGNYSDTD